MASKIETLHSTAQYKAYLLPGGHGGIVVEGVEGGGGETAKVRLPAYHKQFADFLKAFRDKVDDEEGDALCRALLACHASLWGVE